ncbi:MULTISPECIES: heme exporter protein CcmD [Testudinibacter]|uniref:Heme exporter protein D n=1 Tax=Testudinibacter aquarius TaxID=1524974 RepID=A0A4R3XXA0_9PAST|nr:MULTISPECIES: heme exporter protein CcmD [Testudinibacter]TNG94455.1 heme exporter protein CcmD [Pasteurellaceae bacterium UScroc12]TNG96640.1 heme exporter protein CcmD [Pasteurellaceae bacterium USgator41]TNG99446.1 heme exporter protein CcmD [Pasteurellaceae bacterium UScroc31]TNG99516.1 heme exporter protein CcmD [Pasteurellaceae bacterium USgator11]TNH05195.1 heme exporter protein CcmD [Pasteurellaceae bacterium Phil11]
MTPFFQTWQDFLNMGGYGFYVWLCYGVSLLAIVILSAVSLNDKKRLLTQIAKEQARQQRIQQARQGEQQ